MTTLLGVERRFARVSLGVKFLATSLDGGVSIGGKVIGEGERTYALFCATRRIGLVAMVGG